MAAFRLRSRKFIGLRKALLLLVLGLACGGVLLACNVPVFRYALERWRADSYAAIFFHKGPLTDAEREQLRPLEERIESLAANVSLRTVDVTQLDLASESPDALAWKELGELPLPKLVISYPVPLKIHKPVWVGDPNADSFAATLRSPARQELVRRLADGQTAVWILLESGNSEQDEQVATTLERELKKLEKELKLPELTESPEDTVLLDKPLTISFSLLRVKRDATEEETFVATLIGCEPDLAERSDPMVFPVFGRGRALLPLVGAGITSENIQDSASFLVGPCSCQVKEQNPGFDLLLAVDWATELALDDSLIAEKTPAIPNGPPELVPIPAGGQVAKAVASPVTTTVPAEVIVRHSIFPLGPRLFLWGTGGVFGLLLLLILAIVSFSRATR